MAFGDFTPELCEQLHVVPKKVPSKISWRWSTNKKSIARFQAKALTPDGEVLDLSGVYNERSRHGRVTWGFTLSYHRNIVRSYDMALKHKNPGGGKVRGPHKHKFSSSKIPRLAYTPDPPISDKNVHQALFDFLKESNIELEIPYQQEMFLA